MRIGMVDHCSLWLYMQISLWIQTRSVQHLQATGVHMIQVCQMLHMIDMWKSADIHTEGRAWHARFDECQITARPGQARLVAYSVKADIFDDV